MFQIVILRLWSLVQNLWAHWCLPMNFPFTSFPKEISCPSVSPPHLTQPEVIWEKPKRIIFRYTVYGMLGMSHILWLAPASHGSHFLVDLTLWQTFCGQVHPSPAMATHHLFLMSGSAHRCKKDWTFGPIYGCWFSMWVLRSPTSTENGSPEEAMSGRVDSATEFPLFPKPCPPQTLPPNCQDFLILALILARDPQNALAWRVFFSYIKEQ